jgi:hypothetical protein
MAEARKVATAHYKLVLTLDENEAETLKTVVSFVGGDPYGSRRRFIDNIRIELHKAGVQDLKSPCVDIKDNGIWFDVEELGKAT